MPQRRSRRERGRPGGASAPRTSRSSPPISAAPSNPTLWTLPITQREVSARRRLLPHRAVPHWAESPFVPPCSRRTHFYNEGAGFSERNHPSLREYFTRRLSK